MKRITRLASVIVGVLLGLAGPLPAQEGPSILTLLDVGGRQLEIGAEANGLLTALDVQTTGGRRVQAWGLQLTGSGSVTLDLRSDAFDAYLYVAGPGITGTVEDDDSAGACDARVTLRSPSAGTYRVVVSSIGGNTGPYTLTASASPGPVRSDDCSTGGGGGGRELVFDDLPIADRRLTLGQEHRGALSAADTADADGSHVQAWGLHLDAGQAVAIDLVSNDFDAFLYLTGPGLDTPLSDDDGAGGCHARIFYSAQQSGEHRVIVTTLGSEVTGTFTLRTADRPGPVVNEPCGGGVEDFSGLSVEGRTLDRDAPATGRLSSGDQTSRSGNHVQAWSLDARAGETLTVTLRSDDFDPFLRLNGPQLVALSDDDGAGGCDARITFTAPADGTYRVVVTTAFAAGVGSFALEVTDMPAPPSTEPCT